MAEADCWQLPPMAGTQHGFCPRCEVLQALLALAVTQPTLQARRTQPPRHERQRRTERKRWALSAPWRQGWG